VANFTMKAVTLFFDSPIASNMHNPFS